MKSIEQLEKSVRNPDIVWDVADFIYYMDSKGYRYTLSANRTKLDDVSPSCKVLHVPKGIKTIKYMFKDTPSCDTVIIISDTVEYLGFICNEQKNACTVKIDSIFFQSTSDSPFIDIRIRGALSYLNVTGIAELPKSKSICDCYNYCSAKVISKNPICRLYNSFREMENSEVHVVIKGNIENSLIRCNNSIIDIEILQYTMEDDITPYSKGTKLESNGIDDSIRNLTNTKVKIKFNESYDGSINVFRSIHDIIGENSELDFDFSNKISEITSSFNDISNWLNHGILDVKEFDAITCGSAGCFRGCKINTINFYAKADSSINWSGRSENARIADENTNVNIYIDGDTMHTELLYGYTKCSKVNLNILSSNPDCEITRIIGEVLQWDGDLTELNLPSTIQCIGNDVRDGYSNSIRLFDKVDVFDSMVFPNVHDLKKFALIIPSTCKLIILNDNVTDIHNGIFNNVSGPVTLVIGKNVSNKVINLIPKMYGHRIYMVYTDERKKAFTDWYIYDTHWVNSVDEAKNAIKEYQNHKNTAMAKTKLIIDNEPKYDVINESFGPALSKVYKLYYISCKMVEQVCNRDKLVYDFITSNSQNDIENVPYMADAVSQKLFCAPELCIVKYGDDWIIAGNKTDEAVEIYAVHASKLLLTIVNNIPEYAGIPISNIVDCLDTLPISKDLYGNIYGKLYGYGIELDGEALSYNAINVQNVIWRCTSNSLIKLGSQIIDRRDEQYSEYALYFETSTCKFVETNTITVGDRNGINVLRSYTYKQSKDIDTPYSKEVSNMFIGHAEKNSTGASNNKALQRKLKEKFTQILK